MRCEGCGCIFCPDSDGFDREPGDELPRYCTKRCQKRASAKRNGHRLSGNARKRRAYLRAICEAKIGRYPDEETALLVLQRLWEMGELHAKRVYQCPVCGLWHLTKNDPADIRVTQRGEPGELTLEALRDLLADEQEMTA